MKRRGQWTLWRVVGVATTVLAAHASQLHAESQEANGAGQAQHAPAYRHYDGHRSSSTIQP
jgi:hypothetical protein